ncbi:agamous-like MADS-box protein AGL62 [Diospyros lotus]|uniref:agamous-like MADS-box protein AGL62 n=1 Tax=Diospyros lotus TaxID=55363 RepID=UPI002252FB14|nr:agamous-like MADS-box protein AGL62 [Diospyros lotus]
MERKNKGRQRIAMTKMEKESSRQVTFSKRRFGLFKKASELSILCGAQVAVIVFSPGNKAFSFGNPSVNAVIDQFLTGNRSPETVRDRNNEARRNATMMELSQRLNLVENMLEVERQRGRELDQMRIASRGKFWWEEPIDKMNMKQLEKMKMAMEDLKNMAIKQVEKVKQEQETSDVNTFMVRSSFLGGGGSVPPFLAGGASDDPPSLLAGRGFSGAPFDAGASSSAPPMVPGFNRGSSRSFK